MGATDSTGLPNDRRRRPDKQPPRHRPLHHEEKLQRQQTGALDVQRRQQRRDRPPTLAGMPASHGSWRHRQLYQGGTRSSRPSPFATTPSSPVTRTAPSIVSILA